MKFNVSASTYPDGYFAINYGVKVGAYPEKNGVTLRLYKENGKIEIRRGGETLYAGNIVNFENEGFYLVLARIGARLQVYIAPNEREKECRLVADVDTGMKEGGCLLIADRNARSFLCGATLRGIEDFSDIREEKEKVRIASTKHRYMI